MSKSSETQVHPAPAATVLLDGASYTAVATDVSSSLSNTGPFRTVRPEFHHQIPSARDLKWHDDFFDDDDDVIAVFDYDYESMESFHTQLGWIFLGSTIVWSPLFTTCMLGMAPCFLRRNVAWSVHAHHIAITRNGICMIRDRRRTCWGLACTDMAKSTKTIPFDKIVACEYSVPVGISCFCVENILSNVTITIKVSPSSNTVIQISGLKNAQAFQKLVLAMKGCHDGNICNAIPASLAMTDRVITGTLEATSVAVEMVADQPISSDQATDVSMLLREIRDELRHHNALLQTSTNQSTPTAPMVLHEE